jgi:UDP-glucuronate decarboxylase
LELVDLVLAMTGSSSRTVFRPLPQDDPKRRRPDISKAERLLGWTPGTSLEQGLRATIVWFEAEQRVLATAEMGRAVAALVA